MKRADSSRGNGRTTELVPAPMNAKQALFVANYLTGMTAKAAAIAAGYTTNPRNAGWRMLHRVAGTMQAIREGQARICEAAEITTESMVKQLDADRAFAVSTKNATAAVRASEIKAKLAGLLIDRQDVRAIHGVQIQVIRFGDADV